jgi:uncharacterized protein YjiS (DUF1127 family)
MRSITKLSLGKHLARASAKSSPVTITPGLLLSAYQWVQHERAIRKSISTLKQLDDHMLSDIGVGRPEIESHVRTLAKGWW